MDLVLLNENTFFSFRHTIWVKKKEKKCPDCACANVRSSVRCERVGWVESGSVAVATVGGERVEGRGGMKGRRA